MLSVVSFSAQAATFIYDANGNMISDGTYEYEYNDANQLSKVYKDNETVEQYWYDNGGQRIKKWSNGTTTYYIGDYYETVIDNWSREDTSYYWLNGERVTKENSSGTYYYHTDHLGSTSLMTDESGNLVEKIKYFPFGAIRSGGSEKHAYTGKEEDSTGLYYYGARYYNPELRRWIQPDSVIQDIYDPQLLNRYTYVKNNPIKYTDPSGNIIWFLFAAIVIAGVAAEAGYLSSTEGATLGGTLTAGVAGGTAGAVGYGAGAVTWAGASATLGGSTLGTAAAYGATGLNAWGSTQMSYNVMTGQPVQSGMTPESATMAAGTAIVIGGAYRAYQNYVGRGSQITAAQTTTRGGPTGYRYETSEGVGQIVQRGGVSKGTYASWDKYTSSSVAKHSLEIRGSRSGALRIPEYRIEFDTSKYTLGQVGDGIVGGHPEWGLWPNSGGGTEFRVLEDVPISELRICILEP
jgi:RHS repeat-associated protein